jgi:hypothetical protein
MEPEDVVFFDRAIRYTAEMIDIEDTELMFTAEVRREIEHRSAETARRLTAFFDAYQAWADFHRRQRELGIEEMNRADAEHQQLTQLVRAKQPARDELREHLRSVVASRRGPARSASRRD